jgi:hypothetical protein
MGLFQQVYCDRVNTLDFITFEPRADGEVAVISKVTSVPYGTVARADADALVESDGVFPIAEHVASNPIPYLQEAIDRAVWHEDASALSAPEGEFAWRFVWYHLCRLRAIPADEVAAPNTS